MDVDTQYASKELVERMRLIAKLKLDNVKKVLRLNDEQAEHLVNGGANGPGCGDRVQRPVRR